MSTIIEGLKRLRLIEKRMTKNCEEIKKYSSLLNNEKPIFDTEEKQKLEVKQLIQSNSDLETEYCKLKASIDYTNLVTNVQIEDENRTIHGWLTVLRKTGAQMIQTFRSLNTSEAQKNQSRFGRAEGIGSITFLRMYDENEKRAGQRKWEDLTAGKTIEGRLEVINATTDLIQIEDGLISTGTYKS